MRAELGIPNGELLAVTVANLRSEKGYDVLLETAHRSGLRHLPLWFVAAGQGDQAPALADRHRALGLGERFRFLGHRRDALALLTAADIVVLPSHQEGLPVVLMEATSVGAVIVATTVGGVPQVITDGVNGLLVPPGDPEALVDALERLSGDPGLRHRLGEAAAAESVTFDVARASRRDRADLPGTPGPLPGRSEGRAPTGHDASDAHPEAATSRASRATSSSTTSEQNRSSNRWWAASATERRRTGSVSRRTHASASAGASSPTSRWTPSTRRCPPPRPRWTRPGSVGRRPPGS